MARPVTKKSDSSLPRIRMVDGRGDYVKARRKWNPTRERIVEALKKSSRAVKVRKSKSA